MTSHGRSVLLAGSGLFVLACGLRLVHSLRVPVPSTDGATYLWMAEAFSCGDFKAGFDSVFHAGTGLVLAPFVTLGLDALTASKVIGSVLGGVTAAAVWLAARRVAPDRRAAVAGVLCACSFLAVRLPADAYSESVYLPLAATAVACALAGRAVTGGLAIGAAFWVRPEALCLLPLLLVRRAGARRSLSAVGLALVVAACHPLARFVLAGDAAPTPKLAFMAPMGPLGTGGLGAKLAAVGANLVRVPLDAMPALDWVGFPLGLLGVCCVARRDRRLAACAGLALAAGWTVMIAFQVKPRFFLAQAPLLWPLAAACPKRWLLVAGFGIAVATFRVARDIAAPPRVEKRAEAVLGRWLAARRVRQDELVTDLPRVAYYAGLRPPPPAIWTPETLRPLLDAPAVRWLALGALRDGRQELVTRARGFRPVELPPAVQRMAGSERLLLAVR